MDEKEAASYSYEGIHLDFDPLKRCALCRSAYNDIVIKGFVDNIISQESFGMNVQARADLLEHLINDYARKTYVTTEQCLEHLLHCSPLMLKYDMIVTTNALLKEALQYAIQINNQTQDRNLSRNNINNIHNLITTIIKGTNEIMAKK
jgi:hypothetical protein